jgi:hypothetical protein
MLVYVDNIVIAGSTPEAVDRLVSSLTESFPITIWVGLITFLDWRHLTIQGV